MDGEDYSININIVEPDGEEQAYQAGYLPQLSQMPLQEPFGGYAYGVQQSFDSMAQPMPMPMPMPSLFMDGSVNYNEYAVPGQLFPEQQVPMMNFASTSQPPQDDDLLRLYHELGYSSSTGYSSSPGSASASSSVPSTPASMLFPAEIAEGYSRMDTPLPYPRMDTPLSYSPMDIPYSSMDTPLPYSRMDTPLSYSPMDTPSPYSPMDTPSPYSPMDTPSPGGSTIAFVHEDQFQSTTPQTSGYRFRNCAFRMEDGQRRTKQRRACVRCHRAKKECENAGDGTPCQRCQSLAEHKCEYPSSRVSRKSLPKKGTSSVQKKRT